MAIEYLTGLNAIVMKAIWKLLMIIIKHIEQVLHVRGLVLQVHIY